ncbi:MAG: oligosaccharide flippase family protein [Pseudomonadota bacterium]
MNTFSKIRISENIKYQLIRGVSGVGGIKVISTIITLGTGILWARILGPENYGFYAYILSVIMLLGLPTQGGLPTLVMREVAKYNYDYDWARLRGLLLTSNVIVVLISITTVVLACLYSYSFKSSGVNSSAFMWSLALLPLIAFSNVRIAVLKGFRNVIKGSLPEQIVKPGILLFLLAFTYFFGFELSVVGAIQFTIIAVIGSFIFGALLLVKVVPREVVKSKPIFDLKPWFTSVVPLTLFSSLNIANNQIGTVVLGFLGLDEQNGYYRVAFQGAMLLATAMILIESVIAPYIVSFKKQGELVKIEKIASLSACISLLIALPLAITFFFWGEYFISMLFGEDYLDSFTVLVILSIGQLIRMVFGSAGMVLNMMGKEFYVALSALIAFTANLLLCFILAESYGANGIAFSSTISMSLWSGFLAFYCFRVLSVNTTVFGLINNAKS